MRRLTAGGPILGAFSKAVFDEDVLELKPGEVVVMFTDGVTEARNADQEEFGESRLLDCLAKYEGNRPERLLDRIFGAVRGFCGQEEQRDDITVTATRMR
jgi:serine phosphatase RsbU (regulator of sigma subunit)